MRYAYFLCLLVLLFSFQVSAVLARDQPPCDFQPDGSIVCTTGGGGGGDSGGNGEEDEGGNNGEEEGEDPIEITCVPGQDLTYQVFSYDSSTSTCSVFPVMVDNCTGTPLESLEILTNVPCDMEDSDSTENPCTDFSIGLNGISCSNNSWRVTARVSFPEIFLDVGPYPATVVRWPTVLRNGGLSESSGSGGVDYIPNGGGSPGHPQEGDWRDLRMTLTLRPAGPILVTLPFVGDVLLSNGATQTIHWEVPSHPAVGANILAEGIDGLDELPGDMPLFLGRGHAPYKLQWELRYQEYEATEGCIPGPNGRGQYNCGGGTGHRGITGYEWRNRSDGGEIPPSAVANLPSALMADMNNDGTPDAYWDNNLTLRRMDDAGSISNPQYQRSWNWGGVIYWAVREGQGQIGWPGQ